MEEIGLFDAMYTARSIRRLKTDPVPDELITKILDVAIRAPIGGNSQNWLFVVIKDPAQRKKIGEYYRRGGEMALKMYAERERPAHVTQAGREQMLASANHLFQHLSEAPVLILVCLESSPPPTPGSVSPEVARTLEWLDRMKGSNIFPAVQNIILACRALGLGTVLTTVHSLFEDEVKAVVGLPKEFETWALMPIGYPAEDFARVKRLPVRKVTCLDSYGNPWPG
jgi:nitroreductase